MRKCWNRFTQAINVRARERQHLLARIDKTNSGSRVALRGMSHSPRLKCKRTFNATRSPSKSVPKPRIWHIFIWGKELSFDFMLLQSIFRDRLPTRHACRNGNTKVKGAYGAQWHISSAHLGQRPFLLLPSLFFTSQGTGDSWSLPFYLLYSLPYHPISNGHSEVMVGVA